MRDNIKFGIVASVIIITFLCLMVKSKPDIEAATTDNYESLEVIYDRYQDHIYLYIVKDNENDQEYIVIRSGDGVTITPRLGEAQ